MPESDTNMFQKAGNSISRNPGKSATIASGGLSITVAMMLFATKGEIQQLGERQSETWRALQDVQLILMKRADAMTTNNFASVRP